MKKISKNFNKRNDPIDDLLMCSAAEAVMTAEIAKFDRAAEEFGNIAFPADLDRRILGLIDNFCRGQSRNSFFTALKRISRAAAVIVLALVLSVAVLCGTSEAFRAEVVKLVYTVKDNFITIDAESEDGGLVYQAENHFILNAEYVPEGYTLCQEDYYRLSFENQRGQQLSVIHLTADISTDIDNEDVTVEQVQINGNEVELRYKKGSYLAIWRLGPNYFMAEGSVDRETFIRFIKGLAYK